MLFQFYGDLLPGEGFFALWDKTTKSNIWFDNKTELLETTMDAIADKAEGVYFATAAFNETAAINGDKNARTQANVTGKKCFYLDLDAGAKKLAKHGEDKVYATQREALIDAVNFSKDTDLQPTYIVSSGEGLHVYWVLEESISGEDWTRTAKKLSKLFKQYGLKEDSAVTADSARILRPVGTVHENGTEVRILGKKGRTYNIEGFAEQVSNLLADDAVDDFEIGPAPRERGVGINKDILVASPPKSVGKVMERCPAMMDVAYTKRGNVEEPLWRAMLGVIKFTRECDKAAHMFSSGHPDYSKRDTQYKIDNWNAGPTSCAEFGKYCDHCDTCEHKGKIKSPIVLGIMNDKEVAALPPEERPAPPVVPAATGKPWDGVMPDGFFVGEDGYLTYNMPVVREDEDGNPVTRLVKVQITKNMFWFTQWADAEDSDDKVIYHLHKDDGHGGVGKYNLPGDVKSVIATYKNWLGGKGVNMSSEYDPRVTKALQDYTTRSLELIQMNPSRHKVTTRFGMFVDQKGKLMCAHGQYVIGEGHSIHRAIVGPKLRGLADQFTIPLPYSATGVYGADVWDTEIMPRAKRHAEFLKKHYNREGLEKYQLAAMLSLASPLMPFVTGEYVGGMSLPRNGLSVSLFSQDGGKGKTSLMRAVALAYGVPSAVVADQNEQGSTALGRIAQLTTMGSMPMCFDEMGSVSAGAYAALVSAIANGSSRTRATKEGGVSQGTPFSLIATFAANKSARDMVAAASGESDAIQKRLIELDVDHIQENDSEQVIAYQADWAGIADCAGALGAVIHRAMCDRGVAEINALVTGGVSAVMRNVSSTEQAGRFQYRGLGAAMALQVLLKSLGLEIFDWKNVVSAFQIAHDLGIAYTNENTLPSGGLDLLSLALHDMTKHTAVTMTETRRTRHVTKYDEPLVPVPPVVHARHVVELARTYLSAGALREWCSERKVSFTKIVAAAREAQIITNIYASSPEGKAQAFNLLKGMRGSTESMVSCYALDIKVLRRLTGKDPVEGLDIPQSGEPTVEAGE
jgi:hypothetical protein